MVKKQSELQELVEKLYFSEEDLHQAVLDQAQLFFTAAGFRIKKMHAKQDAENNYDMLRAEASIRIRKQFEADGKKGVTEGYIKDILEGDGILRTSKEQLAKAERLDKWSELLLESYRQRKDSLKLIAQF